MMLLILDVVSTLDNEQDDIEAPNPLNLSPHALCSKCFFGCTQNVLDDVFDRSVRSLVASEWAVADWSLKENQLTRGHQVDR